MTKKLIQDGKTARQSRQIGMGVCVGALLLLLGMLCLMLKARLGSSIDAETGLLQEAFFLLPAAGVLFVGGFLTFLALGVRSVILGLGTLENAAHKRVIALCSSVVVLCAGLFLLLLAANSGAPTAQLGVLLSAVGAAGILAVCVFAAIKKTRRAA